MTDTCALCDVSVTCSYLHLVAARFAAPTLPQMRVEPPYCAAMLLPVLFILLTLPSALSLARGPTPPLPPLRPDAPPALPPAKTAYVTVHTHTRTAYAQYQPDGILTMYSTLADTNTTRDRLVLVTHNTPQHIRDLYTAHGLSVRTIAADAYSDQCAYKFNKLHAFDKQLLPEYERVMYLEPDVLLVYNVDHLFNCGHFCMVYSSWFHFTDSLLVIRPDTQTHTRLLHDYSQLHLDRLWSGITWCPEHSWWFLLSAFGEIEAAPLFDPSSGQSQAPLLRLTSSYCLNAMTWYEFFSYRLLRGPAFRNYTDADGIPAYAIGWTGLKPYNWATGLFFNLQWMWADERDTRLGRTYHWMIARWVVGCAVLLWVGLDGVRRAVGWLMRERKKGETGWKVMNAIRSAVIVVMGAARDEGERRKKALDGTPLHSPTLKPINGTLGAAVAGASVWSLPYFWLPVLGVTPLAIVLALVSLNINGWVLYLWVIDRLVPSHIGWSLMCSAHCLLTYIDLQLLRYLYHFSPQYIPNSHSTSAASSALSAADDEHISLMADIESPTPVTPTAASTSSTTPSTTTHSAYPYTYSYTSQLTYSPAIRLPLLTTMYSVTFWEFFTWLSMRPSTLYSEFVVKMFAVFPFVLLMFITHINVWRYVLSQLKRDVEERSGGGVVSSVSSRVGGDGAGLGIGLSK